MRRSLGSTLSGIAVLATVIVVMYVTHNLKHRYDDMQKLKRLQGYIGELNVISKSMNKLEANENDLTHDVGLLKTLLDLNLDLKEAPLLEKPNLQRQRRDLPL